MKNRVIVLIAISITLSVALGIIVLDSLKHNLYDEIVAFDGVSAVVYKKRVIINGAIQVNAGSVTGYKAERQDDVLFVSLVGYRFPCGNPEGEFNFDLDIQTEDLSKIYLKGSNPNQIKIIWEKK